MDAIKTGLNKIMGSDGEYYQSYATEEIINNISNPTYGSYKDGVRWSNMIWDIEEIQIIN